MAKFILHGIIVEEPSKRNFANGVDCVTLKIEEKYKTAYKEVVNILYVDFVGNSANCIPTNIRLAGAPVVVEGAIIAHEYKGRCYYDLRAEQLSLITAGSFVNDGSPIGQAEVTSAKANNYASKDLEVEDDDLPF